MSNTSEQISQKLQISAAASLFNKGCWEGALQTLEALPLEEGQYRKHLVSNRPLLDGLNACLQYENVRRCERAYNLLWKWDIEDEVKNEASIKEAPVCGR